jgi:hypothetical protein
MRTSDDTVSHRDRDYFVLQQKSLNLSTRFLVGTDVMTLGVPSFQYVSLAAFLSYDSNSDLRSTAIVWTVESNRSHRVTAKALSRPFEQRVFCS